MSLGLLVLLPTSLGFGGGAIIKESFGQFNTTSSNEGAGGGGANEQESTTLPTNASTFLLRGLIGSSLPVQGGNTSAENNNNNNSGHVAVGRFRIFANESLVNRFIAEMDLAAIDGTAVHNVTIEETVPHRFEL
ncbi:MAG: hypothetical protein M3270_01715, partial [Thermoproteota archaeon]|nr:hypothetical protein [Thermoproteota archaeon]